MNVNSHIDKYNAEEENVPTKRRNHGRGVDKIEKDKEGDRNFVIVEI